MKTYCLIVDGVVANRAVFSDSIPVDWPNASQWVENDVAQIGWAYANGAFIIPVEPAPPTPTVADYAASIQAVIDQAAASKQFNDGVTLASYKDSTIPAWAAQASAFIAWRDGVWSYTYAQLAAVQAGTRAQPSVDSFLSELPPIVWPA